MIPPLAALFAWPAITAVFFHACRLPLAILVTMLAGYLLLPAKTVVDLPLLPALDKHTVPVLSALLMIAVVAGRGGAARGGAGDGSSDGAGALPGLLPRSWLHRTLLLGFLCCTFVTVLSNSDPLVYGTVVLPGLSPYDGFSVALGALMLLLPALLARKYLAHPETHRLFLQVLCVAGLAYSLPALFEVRMSPQLSNWIYGFFPHVWGQHVRGGGGFRPVVFLEHGLLVAIFMSATILAAFGLFRLDGKRRGLFLIAALWLLGTLVLVKSLGAFVITLALVPLLLFFGVRIHLMAAACIAVLLLSYPAIRGSGMIPIDRIERAAATVSEARAASLRVRLDNEDRMLAKAEERPLFGWGGWGRSRIYDESGNDVTIADGYWIIAFGLGGWARYLSEFGLLTLPLLLLLLNGRRHRIGLETSVLALILAGNLVDLVPNGSNTPLMWLIAGALWGRVELGAPAEAPERSAADRLARARPGYRRAFGAGPADAPAPGEGTIVYTRQTEYTARNRPSSGRT